MVFSSFAFLFFFLPGTILAYFAWPNRTWRNLVLLGSSLLFYAWGEPRYIVLMIASIVVNWALGLLIHRAGSWSNHVLSVGVALNLCCIGVFKYGDFIVKSVSSVVGVNLDVHGFALPIGISFYTFMAISYLVDVSRGVAEPQPNPLFFGLYLTMFPHLIAGPVVRYETIEKEILHRRENLGDFAAGSRRLVLGLSKKILIANPMGAVADAVLAGEPTVGALPAWCAFIAYTFQIYFDFSGYSDMAIGLARMFGFHFLENFNYPYIAKSVTEFWRRWHISLSTFFRDYLYIPLGGNRVGKPRWVFNLLVVWGLTGLWHGASWNFLIWGLYYAVLLIGEKLLWGHSIQRFPNIVQHAYTIAAFTTGWVFFRIDDFGRMREWFGALLGAYGPGSISTLSELNVLHHYPWFVVAAFGSTPVFTRLVQRLDVGRATGWCQDACVLAGFCWCVLSLAMGGFNPFIYFRF